MSHRPAMDPDSAEYSNDDPTWGERSPMGLEECAFCWHDPHPAADCEHDYGDGTVCACVEYEEVAYADAS